ncbi:MAG: hypothetical protein CV087_16090 [Candidatus Brocadia sp. WS118]|nr:MAG: hypothetical protein CV087_16090 [Candidatus Brocadia sp. WS118]
MKQEQRETVPLIPKGMELRGILQGYEEAICQIAWSPDGKMIASPSLDGTIRVWDAESGKESMVLTGHQGAVYSAAWSPNGQRLASGSEDKTLRIWDVKTGETIFVLDEHKGPVYSVAWSPKGQGLASGSADKTIKLWKINKRTKQQICEYIGHSNAIYCLAWSPDGALLASGAEEPDNMLRLWDVKTSDVPRILNGHTCGIFSVVWSPDGRVLASGGGETDQRIMVWKRDSELPENILEGHTGKIWSLSFSADGRLLASKSHDSTVRLWRTDTWQEAARLQEPSSLTDLAFNPVLPVLATPGEYDQNIHIWDLKYDLILNSSELAEPVYYQNAKVIMIGDTESLQSLLTAENMVKPVDKLHIWSFEMKEEYSKDSPQEIREILFRELSGDPNYQLDHRMELNGAALILMVLKTPVEKNQFDGIQLWIRTIAQAQNRQSNLTKVLKKFLIVIKKTTDRNSTSDEYIRKTKEKMRFDGFFEIDPEKTERLKKLSNAICESIAWNALPRTTSTKIFQQIQEFVLNEKKDGRLLSTTEDLFRIFCKTYPDIQDNELKSKFDTSIFYLQNHDLVRFLYEKHFILFQPEVFRGYASSIINAAAQDPEKMGSIAEEKTLNGIFSIPEKLKISNKSIEKLILYPVIEELLFHELVFKEPTGDGAYFVFPSQFGRDLEKKALIIKGRSTIFRFRGALQNIYTTLVVRLANTKLFLTERTDMGQNAVIYNDRDGGACGIHLQKKKWEGELTLFYAKDTSPVTRFLFEEFIFRHLKRHGVSKIKRLFVCQHCGSTIQKDWAEGRLSRGYDQIECGKCGESVSLSLPKEQLKKMLIQIARMDEYADKAREYESLEETLRRKEENKEFDVFFSYNHKDQAAVIKIGKELKKWGILPWIDLWYILPGQSWQKEIEKQIKNSKVVVVFIGPNGLGRWQDKEYMAFMRKSVECGGRVIPVMLPDFSKKPELPSSFLEEFEWVDFRKIEVEYDPLKQLIRGIEGK